MRLYKSLALVLILTATIAGVPAIAQTVTAEAAMAATDRPPQHTERDAARKPEMAFLLPYLKAGDTVLDMGAGGGYTSMLMSTAVGDTGKVYVQNPASWVENYKIQPALDYLTSKRANVTVVVAPFEDIPAPAKPYDVIFAGMIYHDTFNDPKADVAKMNAALLKAMKSGGYFIITDHKAPDDSGTRDTNTTHRIDKQTVINGVTKAGFKLVLDSDALSHPEDDRSLNVFDAKIRGKTDRMALVFQKP
ncbi:methyltransferase domain-containing protein [Asticcacaulis sp. ZE23SCel15]|uniref:class I SAM-dependent methyltransferase n=1 Tax=Asticcacaulis sp. ZE23SCel15 TaxID=3059027 RepID=UPI00265F099B|nr:methyltransferase domain-containing protein [Asticcacaulis sp. ZE23SCel15]WKL56213.1 methyltransferase domain-containing protein [Asticcacaulis sp. ZE23SCel15]